MSRRWSQQERSALDDAADLLGMRVVRRPVAGSRTLTGMAFIPEDEFRTRWEARRRSDGTLPPVGGPSGTRLIVDDPHDPAYGEKMTPERRERIRQWYQQYQLMLSGRPRKGE